MKILRAPFLLLTLALFGPLSEAEPTPKPTPTASSSLRLAPFEERLKAAQTVKVMTSILGVELGDDVATAKSKLDKLSEGGKPVKEETEEDEGEPNARKILWQLKGTDYSTVFLKTDDEGRVANITAFRRPGAELAFDKIGEVKKAPIANANVVAWDVVRPPRPLFRVVAEGAENKARTITLFIVKRSDKDRETAKPKPGK